MGNYGEVHLIWNDGTLYIRNIQEELQCLFT